MKLLMLFLIWLCFAGLLLSLLLNDLRIKRASEDAFYSVVRGDESNSLKNVAIAVVAFILNAIYMESGKISHKKLLIVVLFLNSLFFYGFAKSGWDGSFSELVENFSLLPMFAFIAIANYLTELISLKITLKFVRISLSSGRIRFLVLDGLVLISIFYIMPFLLIYYFENTNNELLAQLILICSPAIYFFASIQMFKSFATSLPLTLPAFLSICLPSAIAVFGYIAFKKKCNVERLLNILDQVEKNGAGWLRNVFLAGIGVFGVAYSIIE